jgi:hypothetical protein
MSVLTAISTRAVGSSPNALSVVSAASAKAVVILFPGDVSAARVEMLESAEWRQWSHFSCEDLAGLTAKRWPHCHCVVVHPPRNRDGFSHYDGWLRQLDAFGDPVDYAGRGACARLLGLLGDAEDAGLQGAGSKLPLHVLAFSHGTIVLNQLMAEMGGPDAVGAAQHLARRVATLCWLDPGLCNEPGAGILLGSARGGDQGLLRAVARRLHARLAQPPHLALHIALTPYQLQPRSWLSGAWRWVWGLPFLVHDSDAAAATRQFERALLCEGLEGIAITTERCLCDQPASLAGHFEVLNAFAAPWEDHHADSFA